MSSPYRILIAEDDPALGPLLVELLQAEGYEIQWAKDGLEALHCLERSSFDLLISDIQMPLLDGFGLLEQAAKHYPALQRIMLTAYNADEYMDLIFRQHIGSVLIKSVPFDGSELLTTIRQLAERQIFGLQHHLHPGTEISVLSIREPGQIESVSEFVAEHYRNEVNASRVRCALVELLTNAMFYGARHESGEDKSRWDTNFILPEHEAIVLSYGCDEEKLGFSVLDRGGRLTKETILYWLNRQITPGANGLPDGIFDSHGRGLFIVRKYMDQLLVHVDPNKQCECIALTWKHEQRKQRYKPIRIIELTPTTI